MNDVQTEAESDEITEAPSVPGPGHRLRLARERMDMQPAEIAERMHLAESLVMALENDSYAELPDPVFTKGYLRNYARIVGEPVDEILAIYARSHPTDEYRPVVHGTEGKARFKTHQVNSSHGIVKGISWFVALGLAVLLVVAWRGYIQLPMPLLGDDLNGTLEEGVGAGEAGASIEVLPFDSMESSMPEASFSPGEDASPEALAESSTDQSVEQDTAAEPVPPADAAEGEPTGIEGASTNLASAQPPVDESADQQSTNLEVPKEDDVGPEESSTVAEATPEPAAGAESADEAEAEPPAETLAQTAPGDRTVALEFSAPCWVDVRDSTGQKVLYGGRGAGERHILEGEPPYRFVLGNNTAVRITVGGEEFDIERFAPNGVARFTLDPSDLTPDSSEAAE